MDSGGCFTAAQRMSCHTTMNADLFKSGLERGGGGAGGAPPPQAAKASRTKAEQIKPEVAQVVSDAKTGRSYSKGKLLGKVFITF